MSRRDVKRRIFLPVFVSAILLLFAGGMSAQTRSQFAGSWAWTSRMDKQKRQTYFAVDIKVRNGKPSGNLFFNELENGDAESDGGVTPFIGTLAGDILTIEFYPEDQNPAYEPVRFKRLKGKSTATAILRLKNGKLEWTQTKGTLEGIPRSLIMNRSK